ncbi:hypothetical protein [Pseudomonas aeruginosa]
MPSWLPDSWLLVSRLAAASYLKLPIVLTNAAWLRLVYLANPARVDEMGTRLASVVQTAWQELSLQPTVPPLLNLPPSAAGAHEPDKVPLTIVPDSEYASRPWRQK